MHSGRVCGRLQVRRASVGTDWLPWRPGSLVIACALCTFPVVTLKLPFWERVRKQVANSPTRLCGALVFSSLPNTDTVFNKELYKKNFKMLNCHNSWEEENSPTEKKLRNKDHNGQLVSIPRGFGSKKWSEGTLLIEPVCMRRTSYFTNIQHGSHARHTLH